MAGNRRHARMAMAGALAAGLLLAVPAAADSPGTSGTTPTEPADMGGAAPPMEPTSPPTISGMAREGRVLTLDKSGYGSPSSTEQRWIRCNSSGAGCVYTPVTGINYPLGAADVNHTIKVRVREGDTTTGYNDTDSNLSATVAAAPAAPGAPPSPPAATKPKNVVAPGISGKVRQGEVLTAKRGTWRGTSPINYRYRWRRCETTCKSIPSARNSKYRLQGADVRKTIELSVSADNRAGTTRALSARTGPVAPTRFGRVRARVTIAGRVTGRGARLSRFRVRAERGTTISILCKGRGCPFKRLSTATPKGGLLRVRRLQRPLRGGIVLGVRVTKLFEIGKYTRLRIRRGEFPKRLDRCLNGNRTVRCRR